MKRTLSMVWVLAVAGCGGVGTAPLASEDVAAVDSAGMDDAGVPAADAPTPVDVAMPVDRPPALDAPVMRDAAPADAADAFPARDVMAPMDVRADVPVVRDVTPPVDAGPAMNAAEYCPGGACVHWWNCRITYQYQYTSSRDWDTDYHMLDGTPIILPHAARLTAVYLVGAGFQPEFTDLSNGQWMHFNHLHLNSEFGGNDHALGPVQLVAMTDPAHADHVYPAGWVIGFSGGGTSRTGYRGTDGSGNVCTGGESTAAHFCAVTRPAHAIDYYLPAGAGGCPTMGWPAALWTMIRSRAPGYASCPSVCNGCGVAHF